MQKQRPVIFLAIGQTLVWAALFYSFPSLLLSWEADFGWTRAQLTGAATLAILLSGLCAPFAGRVIDAGFGAHLMAGSAVMGAIGLAILAAVTSLPLFYLCWGIIGVAMAGALYEPCFAIVTRARGARARGPITAITLVAGFAGTIGFPLFGFGADLIGWRPTILAASAVVAFVVSPLLWLGVKGLGSYAVDEPATGKATPFEWKTPVFILLAAGLSFTALVHAATLHHLLPLLAEKSVDPAFAVLIAALIGPMQVAGRIVMVSTGGFVSVHIFAMAVFATMALAMTALWASDGSKASLIAFVVMFGASYGTISILRPVLARDILGGAGFGAKSGALALPYRVASALSPYLGALTWGWGGYSTMLAICIVLALAGAVFYAAAYRIRFQGKQS